MYTAKPPDVGVLIEHWHTFRELSFTPRGSGSSRRRPFSCSVRLRVPPVVLNGYWRNL